MTWTDLPRTHMSVGGREEEETEKSWLSQITSWRRWGYCGTLMLTLLWHICIIIPKWVFFSVATKGGLTPTCSRGDRPNNAVAHLKLEINWRGERGRISPAPFPGCLHNSMRLLVLTPPGLPTWTGTHTTAGEQEKGAKTFCRFSHLGSHYKGYLWAPKW